MTVEVSGVTNLVVRYKLSIVIFVINFIIINILVWLSLIRNFLRANVDFYQDGTTLFPSYIIWPELPKKVASQESNCCQIWSKRALTTW